jgi:hypothetical protein
MNQFLYSALVSTAPELIIRKLSGGDVGRARLSTIRSQVYRFFRLNATDAATTVPLLPLRAATSSATGRESFLAAKLASTTYHLPTRHAGNVIIAGGATVGMFTQVTGVPPFKVTHINKVEGVVKVHTPHRLPLCGIEQKKAQPGVVGQDYALVASTVQIEVGYIKKFSNANDPTADYYVVSKTLQTPNNGTTKTFLAPGG